MKTDWKFLRNVILVYLAVTAVMFVVLAGAASVVEIESAGAGAAASLANFLLGFFAIEYSYERAHTTFLKVVLGGMLVRLTVMTGAVVVFIKGFGYDALTLMLTLLGYYVMNLVFEVAFLQKKVTLKKPA